MSKRCFGTFGTRRGCFNCECVNNCLSSKININRKGNDGTIKRAAEEVTETIKTK